MQRKTAFGLACLALGAVLLAVGAAEIYRVMSATAHGPALYHLATLALGLAAVGVGVERLGFELSSSEAVQRNEIAHSRWATAQDLITYGIVEEHE